MSSPIPTEQGGTTTAPQVPTTRPQPRRAAATPAEPEKTEAAPPAPAPAAETPRELRAASGPADAEAERRISLLLQRAANDLRNIDYRNLTSGGKEQYDQAKGFSEEAEKALKERNFVYAQTAADKAAKLAAELRGVRN